MADENQGGPPPDTAYTQWHEVQAGESLSKIAKKYYGDPALYTDIFAANRDILEDPNKIFPGQMLRIP